MRLYKQLEGYSRLKTAVLSVMAVLLSSILLLMSGWFMHRQEMKERSEELAIYWNRYAANYYEMRSGWSGLETRLQADILDYPDSGVSVRVYDDHEEVVAQGGVKSLTQLHGMIRKPIVEDSVIVGFTQTASESGACIPIIAWINAIAASIIGCALWWMLYTRWRTESSRMLVRLQERIAEIMPRNSNYINNTQADPRIDAQDQIAAAADVDNKLEHDLIQIERYVRKLETVRRSMVADIAHELRTPLAIMRSQLENALIADTPLTLEKTASMHDELLYLTKLVHDLQELALAEAGKLPLEKRWFSLRVVSEAVIEALQGEAEDQSLSIALHAPTDVMVYADPIRIRQLIVNLIGNAIQHARTQVTVTILQQEGSMMWSVTDDGYGIEEEQLAHLFERFYRNASHARESNRRGLGLGLSIVKQYTEAHGGSIDVDSQWGEGTTFRIHLPVIVA